MSGVQQRPQTRGHLTGSTGADPAGEESEPAEVVASSAARFIMSVAQQLQTNGQNTDDTVHAVVRLGRTLSYACALLPSWDRVELLPIRSGWPSATVMREAVPAMMSVDRVSAVMALVEDVLAGAEERDGAESRLAAVKEMSPPPAWAFVGAAGLGATALAVSFGETQSVALLAIAAAGATGGWARRAAGGWGAGLLVQNALAGLIAGFGAALGKISGLSGDLQLVAACPCMILLPGPHLLNGVLDLLTFRVTLGVSRLAFALTALTAISAGLVVGLALGGAALPTSAVHLAVPFWRDALAVGSRPSATAYFTRCLLGCWPGQPASASWRMQFIGRR